MPGNASLADADATSPRSPLLYGLAALWLLLWMMIALVEVAPLLHTPRVPTWHPVTIMLISASPVAGWLVWVLSTHRFERVSIDPPSRWFTHHLRVLPILVVVGLVLANLLQKGFFVLIGTDYGYAPPRLKIPFDVVKVSLFYFLWLALMFGLLTLTKWRQDSQRMLATQKALAEAQLAQLQAQLRPHFLFNALNTVSALMLTDTARADRVLSQLGDLLRASLRSGQAAALVPFRDELKVLEQYADIMQERFGERAVLHWEIADEVLGVPVPSMLLQPLLENAFKHGVERSVEPVNITVKAARNGNFLRVEIHNTGPGMADASGTDTAARAADREQRQPSGDSVVNAAAESGVGLRNCRERLRLLLGATAEITVANDPAGGVRASVTLPWPAPAA